MSRFSGLAQTIAVGAVLGATYLGNTYQSVNALPNILYYQFLAGSLFASILVPPLVHHVDGGDRARAERVAGGFFGVLILAALGLMAVLVLAGPLIMRLLTLGVSNPAVAAAQARVGMLLLVLFVPQILMYLVAGISGAVMNAHGRFALPAGAPTLENIGMITTLITVAIVFGTGIDVGGVSNAELLFLGLGTTAAVGLHAASVWLGARSCGATLIPRPGWKDPEVRALIRRLVPTLGYTGLEAAQVFAIFMVADRVRGGLVAFQVALSFFFLPLAIVTWPIARALLPQLSRNHRGGHVREFGTELMRGMSLASFITIPTAVAYGALAFPIAGAMAFGGLDTTEGVRLIALSLASLAPGVVGESWFILGAYAFYARLDVHSPLRSMAVRVGTSAVFMVPAWLVHGSNVLPLLGLALSAGSLIGAAHVWWRLRRSLPTRKPEQTERVGRSLIRTAAASLLMIVPAVAAAWAVGTLPHTHVTSILGVVAAAVVGAVVYFALQARWRAPEIGWLKTGAAGLGRPATDEPDEVDR